ncbi:nuclease-related domain-containing protein [Sporosarcina sp. 179-K 8C2 HS]|uniref:nuclease-related domain-containing protein n=1 Tax=Sporosarcina sp. 179-K 8C2 HS TaxID=3142387 RepID=UPI0039A3A501
MKKLLYKVRSAPLKLVGLQALIQRLSPSHPHFLDIQEEIRRRAAGFSGEGNFDRNISDFRPSYPYALLHDICLKQNGVYFQMDSVLITPSYIIIFEIKNLAGKIIVKSNPTQFIHENVERKIIQSPITELERKEIFLRKWLQVRGIDIPINGVVALAYTNELTILETPDKPVVFTHDIPILLYKTNLDKEILRQNEIHNLANEMIGMHDEYNPFPLVKTMDIIADDVLPGIICPNCSYRGMAWYRRKWNCKKCQYQASNSHRKLLEEWFMLLDNKITNREFRNFSYLTDPDVAKRLLKNSGLIMKGQHRNAYYIEK